MNGDPQSRPTGALVSDALQHLSNLVRGEVALARAEVEQNIRSAGIGIAMIVAAVVLALTALNVFSAALVAGLMRAGLSADWSALIVGGTFALIALLLGLKGANALKPSSLAPKRTAQNMRRDANLLKEIVTNDPSR